METVHASLDGSVRGIQDELLEAKKVVEEYRNTFEKNVGGGGTRQAPEAVAEQSKAANALLAHSMASEVQKKEAMMEPLPAKNNSMMVVNQTTTTVSSHIDLPEDDDDDIFEDTIEPDYFTTVVSLDKLYLSREQARNKNVLSRFLHSPENPTITMSPPP